MNPEPLTLRWTPLRWTPPPPDCPKFRSFVFLLPAANFILFFPFLRVFSLNLVVLLKAGTLKCARLAVLWLSCETPAALGPPGFGRARLGPIRLKPACSFELGTFY